jgi:Flp pilus assembly pilin Flp
MLPILVRLHVLALTLTDRALAPRRDERGQTTAEYALVLLGAASLALLIALWAKQGGKVGKLLDAIFDSLVRMVKS